SDVRISNLTAYASVLNQWRRIPLKGFSVGFISVHMLEENSIAASNRPFSGPKGIISDSDAWPRVHVLVLHASCRSHGNPRIALINCAALDEPVKRIGRGKQKLGVWVIVGIECRATQRNVVGIGEIELLELLLLVSAEEAPAQAQVQCKLSSHSPVILKKGLKDFVAVIEGWVCAGLRIRTHLTSLEMRKGIPCGIRVINVKNQLALDIRGGLLVFLCKRYIAAKEHCVVAMDVRHDVPVRVGGVSVLPGKVAVVHRKTARAVSRAIRVANRNSRDLVRLSE